MPFSLYGACVPAFLQTLNALSGIIDKAEAHAAARRIDPNVLLNARLYPDMFPFLRQVQIACDFAKNTVGRLGGEPPKFPDEETSFADLKARIARTIDYIKSVTPDQVNAGTDKDITFPLGPQKTKTLQGTTYLVNFAMPNFYFHATTAYAILRHNGVELGKPDFTGPL